MVSHYVKGLFIITAGINACDKEKAQEAILKQLDDMKKGDFSDEEITTAIRNIKSSFRGVTDSIRSINKFYVAGYLEGKDTSPLEEADMLDVITREDVIRCANSITVDTVYFLKGGNGEE
jgi:predicted Zn-dependent peptidase